MGQLCFPLCQPRVPGAHVCRVFVATSFNATLLPDRPCRCEPPPSRNVFSRPLPLQGRLAQLSLSMPFHRGLPPSRHIRCSSVVTGDPGRRQRRCAPSLLSRSACAGTAAVRTAKPVPVASSCSPKSFPRDERALLHAATELQGRRLDTGPSSCWWFQG